MINRHSRSPPKSYNRSSSPWSRGQFCAFLYLFSLLVLLLVDLHYQEREEDTPLLEEVLRMKKKGIEIDTEIDLETGFSLFLNY